MRWPQQVACICFRHFRSSTWSSNAPQSYHRSHIPLKIHFSPLMHPTNLGQSVICQSVDSMSPICCERSCDMKQEMHHSFVRESVTSLFRGRKSHITLPWVKVWCHSFVVESVTSHFGGCKRHITISWLKGSHHTLVVESVTSLFGGRKGDVTFSWLKASHYSSAVESLMSL